jgi:bifunctional enzyme CysN/CysC
VTAGDRIPLTDRQAALGYGGATVWLTGLPGAGKTTLAAAAERMLLSLGRPAYRLDGDEVRRELCSDLGFDRESRAENVRRVAHIARKLSEASVIASVALISPFAVDRRRARELHDELELPFIEVFIDTPIEICEQRDPKGLYARARRGEISRMTGAGDTYEAPEQADIVIQPGPMEQSVDRIRAALVATGALAGP